MEESCRVGSAGEVATEGETELLYGLPLYGNARMFRNARMFPVHDATRRSRGAWARARCEYNRGISDAPDP